MKKSSIQAALFMLTASLTIISCLFMSSCNRNHLYDAGILLNASLDGKVKYLSSDESWQSFGSDGHRVEVYQIIDLDYLVTKSANEHLDTFDNRQQNDSSITNPDYSKYIENGAGFYKSVWNENKMSQIVIDTINNKMIYYYCFI